MTAVGHAVVEEAVGARAARRPRRPRRIALYAFLTIMAATWLFYIVD